VGEIGDNMATLQDEIATFKKSVGGKWISFGGGTVTLDDDFSIEELQKIIVFMERLKKEGKPDDERGGNAPRRCY
jgi:hypothetical protein